MMRPIPICIALSSLLVTPAFAHTVAGSASSFVAGVSHPFSGVDHLIAITLVGMWSVLVGGNAISAWPLTFVAAMLGGFAAANAGLQIGFVEAAICLSVVLLGGFIAFELRVSVMLGTAIVWVFAFFHGHAHGTEAIGTHLPYVAGFTLASVTLLVVGVAAGFWAKSSAGRFVVRAAGGCAALIGLSLLGGLA